MQGLLIVLVLIILVLAALVIWRHCRKPAVVGGDPPEQGAYYGRILPLIGGVARASKVPPILYHGTKYEIPSKILDIRPSQVVGGELVVFGTQVRWLALVFVSGASSSDLDFGWASGVPYIAEMYPGAFSKLKTSGYIHTISGKGFQTDKRLGMPSAEFISYSPVKIKSTETIPDVWSELRKEGDKVGLQLVSDSERSAFFRRHGVPES